VANPAIWPASLPRLTTETITYSRSGNAPEHDLLPLPGGGKVGETETEKLRSILGRFGIAGAFTIGRAQLVAEYARQISEVAHAASLKAITEFLESREKQETDKC
jgi:hypothetical protein